MNSLTVFFDMGGTLVESPDFFEIVSGRLSGWPPDKKAYNLVLTKFMQIYRDREAYSPFLSVEGMLARTLTSLAREHGYLDLSHESHDLLFEVYLHKSDLFSEVISVLDKLLSNSARMVIASDSDTHLIEEEMTKFSLNKYFIDKCVSDSKAYKPAVGFTNYLKKYTAGNKEHCYFIGDNLVDVESGRRLGIKSVLVDRKGSETPIDADYVISDLTGLLPILEIE